MPKSTSPRKKKKRKIAPIERKLLQGQWLTMFERMRFSEQMLIDKNGNKKKTHILFNRLFLEHLIECQNDAYMPSKDALEEKCQEIFFFATNKVQFTDIDLDRMCVESMNKAFDDSKLETFLRKSEDGLSFFADGFMIVDTRSLSQDETNFIIKSFDAKYDTELDSLTYKCLDYPVKDMFEDYKGERVRLLLVRKAKRDLAKLLNEHRGMSIEIGKDTLMQVIKDKLLLFFL
nr:hypothetical protein [Vibrio splendidus]MCC4882986.1 hypothetical protein [Vibrio splendidus]